ncbi:MAG: hypothetical protein Q4Q07_03785 [Tissierellia bacterium]|nr:hypothetical protein [Tissierellia bacterium]
MNSLIFLPRHLRLFLIILYLLAFIAQVFVVALTNFSYKELKFRLPEYIVLGIQGYVTYYFLIAIDYARWGFVTETFYFPINFLIFLYPILLLIRGVYLSYKRKKYLNHSISPMSIRSAIDTLDSGLLIYNSYGGLVLINDVFVDILKLLFGKVHRNAFTIWESLNNLKSSDIVSKQILGDSIILRFKDRSYEFTTQEISLGKKTYYQILAANISTLDKKNKLLEQKKVELDIALEKIREMEKVVEEIVEEREKIKIKIRLHDHLGQKLSMLQSYLYSNVKKPELLENLKLLNVIEDIHSGFIDHPEKEIYDIIDFFTELGISIDVIGGPPKDLEINRVFAQIIKEALNNALLHSEATEITITSLEDDKGYLLMIENNGNMPKTDIIEGVGLRGMRYRLSKIGGSLFIKVDQTFQLKVLLAKK